MNRLKKLPNSLIFILILVLALGIAYIIIQTAPKPERKITPIKERLVEVIDLKRSDSRPSWLAGGEVTAAQQVALSSQVNGRVDHIDAAAIPGAFLSRGSKLAQLDPQDFQFQLIQKESSVIQAQADLDIELGQGRVAQQDFNTSQKSRRKPSEQDKALILREPQKKSKQAALLKAQTERDNAQLNLQRTQIRMPFDGQIISRSLSIGSQVTTGSVLFNIASSEEYWLEVKVAKQYLPFLDKEMDVLIGQPAWPLKDGKATWHKAKILHVLPQVDTVDRQAKLLISIKDPLALTPGILMGDYVDVRLFGREILNAYEISSQYLIDENSVWVVNDKKLYKRQLNVTYQGREHVWVNSGFQAGDQLLVSKLGTITEGTPVRFNDGVK